MADTVKQIGIKQQDGTYLMKDIGVDASNVDGLSSASVGSATTATKATGDKNAKDITTYVASISKNGANIRTTNGAGKNTDVNFTMGAASASAAGSAGFVPAPAKGKQGQYLRGDGTWNTPTDTRYSGSDNVSITNKVIDLTASGATAGSYGPSVDVTGTNGTTISVPNISVDAKGRITSITNKTYTSVDTGSKVFTGSLSEWNQLSTAEKKTYDFISNDEPGGTGNEFPANRVSYDNTVSGLTANDVQEAVDEVKDVLNAAMPRTATGTTLAQLLTAIGKLSEKQEDNCVIKIDFRRLRRITSNTFNFVTLSGTQVVEIKLDIGAGTYKQYINNGDVTDLSITAWTLYYQGTPIS